MRINLIWKVEKYFYNSQLIFKSISIKNILRRRSDVEAGELGVSPAGLLDTVGARRGLQVEPPGDPLGRPVSPACGVRGPAIGGDASVPGPECSVHGSSN